jgi:hypothetical protein
MSKNETLLMFLAHVALALLIIAPIAFAPVMQADRAGALIEGAGK